MMRTIADSRAVEHAGNDAGPAGATDAGDSMGVPLHQRGYDVFLSHAHVDAPFANDLYDWLTGIAGFQVWFDAKEMPAGTAIATGLNKGIEGCRAFIVVGTPDAVKSGWVQKEINVAQDEQARYPDFRLVPIIIGEACPESELRGVSWIKTPAQELTPELAMDVLRALHPSGNAPNPRNSRDLYVSASWQTQDNASAVAVCRHLASEGFRLVGDSRTQLGFSANRIEEIISSCGAVVCVVPFRGDDEMCAESGPYRYFVREIDTARGLGLATLVFADPRLAALKGYRREWAALHTDSQSLDEGSLKLISGLHDLWQPPKDPHYIFLATDLDSKAARHNSDLRRLVESITGMPTIVGPDIEGEDTARRITDSISRSFLTIADLTGSGDVDFNLDVSIEAGIAYATKRNLRLIARGKARRPPFMLRSAGQLKTYGSEAEYYGLIRSLCWPFRRRVINRELVS